MNLNTVELIEQINNQMDDLTRDTERCKTVSGKDLGLTSVCARFWIDQDSGDLISSKSQMGSIAYYGGFEYLDDDHVTVLGDWVVYSSEAERVKTCIGFYQDDLAED